MSALRLHLPSRPSEVAPRVLVWILVAGLAVFFASVYFDDGMPSPYGLCYAGRGRPIPCEVQKKNGPATNRRQPASLLPVATP
jgi:hypothetical protein